MLSFLWSCVTIISRSCMMSNPSGSVFATLLTAPPMLNSVCSTSRMSFAYARVLLHVVVQELHPELDVAGLVPARRRETGVVRREEAAVTAEAERHLHHDEREHALDPQVIQRRVLHAAVRILRIEA